MNKIIADVHEAYYTAYRQCHNREQWDKELYDIINDAESTASIIIDSLQKQLAKQAEIVEVLKDCVETIAEYEVGKTAAKLASKSTMKRVEILEAKYKGKE